MASPTYTLYKRVPENGKYRYRRAAYHPKNHKVINCGTLPQRSPP